MKEQFKKWAQVAGLSPAKVKGEEDLAGLFQIFRPDGSRAAAIFEGVAHGAPILERLMRAYAATADGYRKDDAYFIVRKTSLTTARALELAQAHLTAMQPIAKAMDETDLVKLLKKAKPVLVNSAPESSEDGDFDDESPDVWLHDQVTDYMIDLDAADSTANLLDEAFFTVANDLYLKYYFLWPLYEKASKLKDPFAPYFEMWASGVTFRFETEDRCVVYMGT